MLVVATVPVTARTGAPAGGYYPSCLWDGLPMPDTAPLGRRWRFLLAPREPDPRKPAGRGAGRLQPLPALARKWPPVGAALLHQDPGPRWAGLVLAPPRTEPTEAGEGEEGSFLLLAVLAALNLLQPAPLPPPLLAEEACRLLCRSAGPPADLACLLAAASAATVAVFPCMKRAGGGNIAARR